MKPYRRILAERLLAQHCPELLGNARSPRDRKQALADWLGEACGRFAEELRPLLIGGKLRASTSEPVTQTAGSIEHGAQPGQVHFLVLPAGPGPRMLISFDTATALAQTDRLFGGSGEFGGDAPSELPHSASLALQRIVCALAQAFAPPTLMASSPPRVATHHILARLEAFPRGEYCLNWTLTVEQDGQSPWSLSLVLLELDAHALVDGQQPGTRLSQPGPQEADGPVGPFAEIPLELTAVLADLRLPVEQLIALAPGQLVPLAPRREVPLQLGGKTIGFGAVGTLNNCVALRLTSLAAS